MKPAIVPCKRVDESVAATPLIHGLKEELSELRLPFVFSQGSGSSIDPPNVESGIEDSTIGTSLFQPKREAECPSIRRRNPHLCRFPRFGKCIRRGSNPQPLPSEGSAIPLYCTTFNVGNVATCSARHRATCRKTVRIVRSSLPIASRPGPPDSSSMSARLAMAGMSHRDRPIAAQFDRRSDSAAIGVGDRRGPLAKGVAERQHSTGALRNGVMV